MHIERMIELCEVIQSQKELDNLPHVQDPAINACEYVNEGTCQHSIITHRRENKNLV